MVMKHTNRRTEFRKISKDPVSRQAGGVVLHFSITYRTEGLVLSVQDEDGAPVKSSISVDP